MTFLKTALGAATALTFTAGVALADNHSMDIVDTAAGNDDFETLVAAVEAAGLVDTLKGEGPFTVFAPTDAAFEELGSAVDDLMMEENRDQLTSVLTYHVVPGKIMSSDLEDGAEVETVEGSNVTVDLDDGPMVNDANIVTADIETSNGVIHVIDKVIMPPEAM